MEIDCKRFNKVKIADYCIELHLEILALELLLRKCSFIQMKTDLTDVKIFGKVSQYILDNIVYA